MIFDQSIASLRHSLGRFLWQCYVVTCFYTFIPCLYLVTSILIPFHLFLYTCIFCSFFVLVFHLFIFRSSVAYVDLLCNILPRNINFFENFWTVPNQGHATPSKNRKTWKFLDEKHENFPPKPCRSGWSHNDEPTLYALRLTRSREREKERERERERNRTVVFFHKEGWYTGGKAGVGNHLQVGNFSYESPRTLCATGKRTRRIRVTIQVFPLLTHSADFFSVVSVFLRWSSRKNV